MCRTQTRPRSGGYMTFAGIALMTASIGILGAVAERVPPEHLALVVAASGLTIGAMMIYGSAMVERATRIEEDVLANTDKLDGQLAEDPDVVTHIDRRRL